MQGGASVEAICSLLPPCIASGFVFIATESSLPFALSGLIVETAARLAGPDPAMAVPLGVSGRETWRGKIDVAIGVVSTPSPLDG